LLIAFIAFIACTAVLNALCIPKEKASAIFDLLNPFHESDGTISLDSFFEIFRHHQHVTGHFLEKFVLKHPISFADVGCILTSRKGVAIISYSTSSMTSHTITIDVEKHYILDPDIRNFEVMKFTNFHDTSFHKIVEKLHVLDVFAPVISHLYFVCRKKARNNKKMKSTVLNT